MREQSRNTMIPHCFSACPFLRHLRHSMAMERHSWAMCPSSLHLKQARALQSWWWWSPRQQRHFTCSRSSRQFFAMCPRFPHRKHFTMSLSSSPSFVRLSKQRTGRPFFSPPSSSSFSAASGSSPSFCSSSCSSASAAWDFSLLRARAWSSSAIFLILCSRQRSLTYLVDSLPSMRQVKRARASVWCMGFSRVFSSTASSLPWGGVGSISIFLRRSILKTLYLLGWSCGGCREGLLRVWTGTGCGSLSEEEISMGLTVSFCLRCCFSESLAFLDLMSDLALCIIKELILKSHQQAYYPNFRHSIIQITQTGATHARHSPPSRHRTKGGIGSQRGFARALHAVGRVAECGVGRGAREGGAVHKLV